MKEVIGRNVRKRRVAAGLKQSDLARTAGISYNQLNHIEVGRYFPSIPVYVALCEALQLNSPPLLNQ